MLSSFCQYTQMGTRKIKSPLTEIFSLYRNQCDLFNFQLNFMYGQSKAIRYVLHDDIEIVDKLEANEKPWTTIPDVDLQRKEHECVFDHCPSLEIDLPHVILKENVNVMVPPDCVVDKLSDMLNKYLDDILPIVVYMLSDDVLTDSVSYNIQLTALA